MVLRGLFPLGFEIRRCPHGVRRRRFWRVLFCLILILSLPWEVWGGEVLVRLPGEIRARDFRFYLGEYGTLEGSKRDCLLAGGVLLEAPGGLLLRDRVLSSMRRLKPLGVSVRLDMPSASRVVRKGEDSLEIRLARLARWPWRVEVLLEVPSGEIVIPLGFRDGFPFVYVKGPQSEELRRVSLRWHQPVVVALVPLRRGQRVDRASVALGLSERTGFGDIPSSIEQVEGRVVRLPVRSGGIVKGSSLDGEAAVSGGQQVSLVCAVGGVEVIALGRSVDSGRVGERVRVMNLASRRVISGVVEGPGVVRVEGGDG
ncbi:MAG: flagellar basal body P-ring formation chaperone FlgA [Thermanaerothrix sp.]|nr:flagellar basal body P-ring formation chaperone FlgA [Thermanaerothrix sp.]